MVLRMESKKEQLQKELDQSVNELDELSNPTIQDRFKYTEDLLAKLRTLADVEIREDKELTEKYVQGMLKAAEFLTLIWRNHPELQSRS